MYVCNVFVCVWVREWDSILLVRYRPVTPIQHTASGELTG